MSAERPVFRPGKLASFAGRSGRAEFWSITGLLALAAIGAFGIDVSITARSSYPATIFVALLAVAILPASLCRRLHDRGRRGRWLVLPLLGPFFFLAATLAVAVSDEPASAASDALLGPVLSVGLMVVNLVSLFGGLWMIVELALSGEEHANRFGPPPSKLRRQARS